jgi:hypothetical protein
MILKKDVDDIGKLRMLALVRLPKGRPKIHILT